MHPALPRLTSCRSTAAAIGFAVVSAAGFGATPAAANGDAALALLEGQSAYDAMDVERAREHFLRAHKQGAKAERARAALWLGATEAELGRFNAAKAWFRRAFSDDPTLKLPRDMSPKLAGLAEEARATASVTTKRARLAAAEPAATPRPPVAASSPRPPPPPAPPMDAGAPPTTAPLSATPTASATPTPTPTPTATRAALPPVLAGAPRPPSASEGSATMPTTPASTAATGTASGPAGPATQSDDTVGATWWIVGGGAALSGVSLAAALTSGTIALTAHGDAERNDDAKEARRLAADADGYAIATNALVGVTVGAVIATAAAGAVAFMAEEQP